MVYGVGKHNHQGHRSDVYDDNTHCDDDVDDDVLGSCSDTYIKRSTGFPNMMLDDQMCDDYEREKNLERKNSRCVQKKGKSKVNMQIDDHTKVDIFTNELNKYMKVMNELEEHNFGSLLKRIITKCDLNALLFGENTEMVPNGK